MFTPITALSLYTRSRNGLCGDVRSAPEKRSGVTAPQVKGLPHGTARAARYILPEQDDRQLPARTSGQTSSGCFSTSVSFIFMARLGETIGGWAAGAPRDCLPGWLDPASDVVFLR